MRAEDFCDVVKCVFLVLGAVTARLPFDVKSHHLSASQFSAGYLCKTVDTARNLAGLAPQRLELEITESVLLRDDARTIGTLHGFRSKGIRIALDDFGTAFASLSYLRSFPFDTLN